MNISISVDVERRLGVWALCLQLFNLLHSVVQQVQSSLWYLHLYSNDAQLSSQGMQRSKLPSASSITCKVCKPSNMGHA